MFPPLFAICNASTAVKNLLGTNPLRVFPFGEAPQTPTAPYAVWQIITGFPENYLGEVPDMDTFVTQVDVYGTTVTSARNAAKAIRDAVEPVAHIVAWRQDGTDKDTGLKRYSFDIDFKTPR